tara:strand:- start:614 stop:1582 length:969 start_codon:yes stop_codon:yes gene_type:complete
MSDIKKKLISIYLAKYFDQIKKIKKFNNLNQKTKYYVIATSKKKGFFSLLLFVLNHIKYAKKQKLIPVIDMKHHQTLYNENKIIFGTKNSWEYYFKKINKINIDKIYKNKKFKFCKDENIITKNNKFNLSLKNIYTKYIRINNNILIKYRAHKARIFKKNDKILGIHFRGTDMKYSPGHPLPPSKKQISEKIKNLLKKYHFNKIFLVTEDINNFNFILSNFSNYSIFHINNYKTSKLKVFDTNHRKYHKYKMGEEALINSLLLSNCNLLISSQTGISDFAKFLNPSLKLFKIDNGFNSNSIFLSLFKWQVKKILPKSLGGFH